MLANGHLALASFLFSNGHAERLVAIIQRKDEFFTLLPYIVILPYFAIIDGTISVNPISQSPVTSLRQ